MLTNVYQSGTLELVGATEKVDTNEWAPEVELPFTVSDPSGEILGINLSMRTTATGVFFIPAGKIAVFRSDPAITNGAVALGANIHGEILGILDVVAGDWYSDTGGSAIYLPTPIPFFPLKILYFAFFNEDTTSINAATGDEEILEANILFRIEDR